MLEINSVEALKVAFIGDAHIRPNPPRSRKDDYYQSLLTKIESLAETNDILFFLGDFFDKPQVDTKTLYSLIEFFTRLKERGARLFTIVGNHDIFNYNETTLTKSTIGILSWFGLVQVFDSVKVNGIRIDRLPLTYRASIQQNPIPDEPSILLGHYYFEYEFDKQFSLTAEMVKDIRYDYLILGHDHECHEPRQVSEHMVLLRPGSLARTNALGSQLSRTPTYYQFQILNGEVQRADLLGVPGALPPAQVFYDTFFAVQPTGSYAFLSNLAELLDSFERTGQSGQRKISQVLTELQCPTPVMDYIRLLHTKANEDF